MTPPQDGQQVPGHPDTARGPAGSRTVATRPPAHGIRRYLDIRNWRVRSKLIAVLVIPTVAFLLLAGINLVNLMLDARAYEFDARTAELGRQVTDLVHEVQMERDLTPGVLVVRDESSRTRLAAQQRQVDEAVREYRAAASRLRDDAGPALEHTMSAIDADLSAMQQLRDAVRGGNVTLTAALDEYSTYVQDLLRVTRGFTEAKRDPLLGQTVQALEVFSQSKERASQARGLLYAVALRGSFEAGDPEALTAALAREQAATEQFVATATERQSSLVSEAVRGQAALTVFRLQDAARHGVTGQSLDVDPEQWLAASSTRVEQMRHAESALLQQVINRSQALGATAVSQSIVTAGAIAAVLFFTLILSLYIARSMVSHLSRLRAGALDVAQVQLPETVDRLRHGDPGPQRPTEIVPVGVHSPDELGQLAAAFDAVHRQALWLATEQALLRRNVNAMFINFSRRSQSLVERQLQLIDDLEANEQNPDALDNLFRLDHLATRMRRNNESLLVIAGSETTRRWSAPVPLPDVVLAAVSEIEHFTRVTQRTPQDIALYGHAVSDIVHLLAELLENATRSSSPQSSVMVTGSWARGGSEALLEIEDSGVGMTRRDLAEANRRLSGQPDAEVPASAQMGLFVVSRLARRHGISVALAESRHGGVSANVWLPASLVTAVVESEADEPAPPAVEPGPAAPRELATPSPAALRPAPAGPPAAPVGAVPATPAGSAAATPSGKVPATPAAAAPAAPAGQVAAPASGAAAPAASPPVARSTTGERPMTQQGLPMRTPRPVDGAAPPPTVRPPSPEPAPGQATRTASAEPPVRQPVAPPASPQTPQGGSQPPDRVQPAPPARVDADESPVVLSVFDSVSEWFRQQATTEAADGDLRGESAAPTTSEAAPTPATTGTWTSAGDQGWAAAEEAREPVADGVTPAGLPIRRPMAHFVPGSPEQSGSPSAGSAEATAPGTPATPGPEDAASGATPPDAGSSVFLTDSGALFGRPTRPSPERVRGLLSNYYRGVREAREVQVAQADDRSESSDRQERT